MNRTATLVDIGVGIFIAYLVSVGIRRLVASVARGEIYAVQTQQGDGLLGFVERAQNPRLFWLVVALHGFFLVLAVVFYFVWLANWSW